MTSWLNRFVFASRSVRLPGSAAAALVGLAAVPVAALDPHFFALTDTISPGISVNDLLLANIDGDGDLDLILANSSTTGHRVFLNDGAGNFTDSGAVIGAFHARGVGVGLLNGDALPDLFFATAQQGNRIWFNAGGGTFTDSGQSLSSRNSEQVELADIDGDTDLDAIVADHGPGSGTANFRATVYQNNGSGVFTEIQALGAQSCYDVVVRDFDGINGVDVFMVNDDSDGCRLFLNNGGGVFSDSGQTFDSVRSEAAAAVDFDGDTDLDIVIGGGFLRRVDSIWLNDGSGNFTRNGAFVGSAGSTNAILAFDFDGDTRADIVSSSVATNFWAGDNTGEFEIRIPELGVYQMMTAGDIDGDGDIDILATGGSGIYVLRNGGGSLPVATNNQPTTVPANASAVIGPQQLLTVDNDTAAASIVYTITTFPANAQVIRNGTTLHAGDNAFTQADVDAGLLSVSAGFVEGHDAFTFTTTAGADSLASAEFTIDVIDPSDRANALYTTDVYGVLYVNESTGDRAVISDMRRGEGEPLFYPLSLMWVDDDTLYLIDALNDGADRLVEIDIPTGNRTVLAEAGDGLGPDWDDSRYAALAANGDVLVPSDAGIVRIVPATGARQIVSSGSVGTGPSLDDVTRDIVEEADGKLVALTLELLRIEPSTGDRTSITAVSTPSSLTIADDGQLLVSRLIIDWWGIVGVDPTSGAQTTISTGQPGLVVGTGPVIPPGSDVTARNNGSVYLAGTSMPTGVLVLRVDLETGERTAVSANPGSVIVGDGPAFRGFTTPASMAFPPVPNAPAAEGWMLFE